ncbi:hypothetical protein N7466_005528 [Penicillium verhagenii]|uniref:uncharacterized protein n=1 Tax=Penicillium verhagenii TaxID=1562060 RepID=UPI0025453D89|nr:uncharacterized protein N7466_005528 [Penicillium verhagenii]KAJ5930035.1 hypothetical protein N7466_005528 [Penicillium verhagenii]
MPDPTPIPEGYVGNLTPIQEEKLQKFWKILQQSWDASLLNADDTTSVANSSVTNTKSRRRFFSFSRAPTEPTDDDLLSTIPPNLLGSLKRLGAGVTELRAIQSILTQLPGAKLRAALVSMLKQDHPDALCLRFLRAEKWDVPKAWIKLVRTLDWRVNGYKVDELMARGEEYAFVNSNKEGDSIEKKDGEGFLLQARTGKGHLRGIDLEGRPICIVRVRTHQPGVQTTKGLNDYIIQMIEIVRLLMVPPVESMAIVFDLTAFSISNWELAPVKFIIDSFQENYPESLGAMIFYNAPWIFSGFWKIISGLLDPVVASKVHFVTGAGELAGLVPAEHIIKELGGPEDWENNYIEPRPNENERLRDTATRDVILEEREALAGDLFNMNAEWVTGSQDSSLSNRRDLVIEQLSANYWKLDPYVRARCLLDRTGVIKEGGNIEFYPEPEVVIQSEVEEKTATTEEANGIQLPMAA